MLSWRNGILWRRALDWLAAYHPLVIAVTGTSGKSTAAAAIAHVLGKHHVVRWSTPATPDPAGLALAIMGVERDPKTITWYTALTASFTHELAAAEPTVLILEISATRPGDIDWVATHLSPDITVVTNVGTANTELFHSKNNVAHELSSLVAATNPRGTLIVNADDELTNTMPTLAKAATISFGVSSTADVRLNRANRLPDGGFAFEVTTHQQMAEVHVPQIVARQQLPSLLAALAVGHALQIPLKDGAKALHSFTPLPGRMASVAGKNNARVLDDSATATPESMLQALETLRALVGKRRIAVLGDIDHLGRESERAHRNIGRLAAQTATIVIAVGEQMRWAGSEALKVGADVHHFAHADDVGKWLVDFVQTGDTILVSGGR